MHEQQKILIVDDKPENLFALKKVLDVLDAEVIQAASANDALVASLNHEFALAIVDVQMPEMDGYELAELLRDQKHTRNLPIIFLSAVFYDEHHVFRGYDAGAVDFITKPYHPKILLGKAAVFLELFRQRMAGKRMAAELKEANQALEARVRERTAKLERANAALKESEQKLRSLSGRLLSAQEEERKRIAAELHDSIGSTLGAIKFSLESTFAEPGVKAETRQTIAAIVQMTVHAIEEVRRIIGNLRPPLLDRLGLISAIAWLQQQYETLYGGIAIRKQIVVQEKDIPEELKIVIFRVIQEAFYNMAKYSRAAEAHLVLAGQDGRLELHFRDDGIGFNAQDVPGVEGAEQGLGLTSMRERVELSGGQFAIEAAAGKGTRIQASWNVPQALPAFSTTSR
ncbi:MAG: response regulator [Desulfobacteraceae bacterium]|nr:MAG: response regulator [Desulfobacteraceae bacterium]